MSESWVRIHNPIDPSDVLPPERKCVCVWCASSVIPWVGYLRYAAGEFSCPFFVVPHGNENRPVDVIAWIDCLPDNGPKGFESDCGARGFPARAGAVDHRESVNREEEPVNV